MANKNDDDMDRNEDIFSLDIHRHNSSDDNQSTLSQIDQLLSIAANDPIGSIDQVENVILPQLRHYLDEHWSQSSLSSNDNQSNQRRIEIVSAVVNTLTTAVQLTNSTVAVNSDEIIDSENKSKLYSRPIAVQSFSSTFANCDKLDSFGENRRLAIEQTIITDITSLPRIDDLAGLDEAKEALTEALIDPLLYSEWFMRENLKPWRCILLFGPPGTGKSHLSQSFARRIDTTFYNVSSSDLISSWSGQSEKLIRELFDHALSSNSKSAVIFIDEIDSLCRQRNSKEDDANRRVKTELLMQLQRLHDQPKLVLLICATNCPWELDQAFLRRFEKRIYVSLPNMTARIQLLQRLLKETPIDPNMNWQRIGEMTNGFSGDDLRRFARELSYKRFRDYKKSLLVHSPELISITRSSSSPSLLSQIDIDQMLITFTVTVQSELLSRYEQFNICH